MRLPLLALVTAAVLAAGCSDDASTSAPPLPAGAPSPVGTASPTPAANPTAVTSTSAAPRATETPADPLSPRPGLESPAPLGQPTCKGPAVTVTDADTLVTPQYKREIFVLRTNGPACQLEGYPKVVLRGADGRALAVTARHGGFGLPPEKPAAATLSRTTSLSFALATARDGSCTDVTAVDVTLPGTTTVHRTATELRVCGSSVGLSPVHRQGDDE
jgi:hypothetical protein